MSDKPKLKPDKETFTLIIEKKYRKFGRDNHDGINNFNYSAVIRQAVHDYYVEKGWV